MAANNNNGGPAWYPEYEPSLKPRTNDWMRLFTDNVYALRGQSSNLSETIQNVNQDVTQQITKLAANFNAAANNNNANAQKPVLYGTHDARVANFSPETYAGYLYIETDRFQAAYYANGSAWVLVEGTATGAFEFRYTGLNQSDQGLTWIETSRNNVAGLPPYPTYRWSGAQWGYQSGAFYRPQNGLATLAGSFNSANSNYGNDAGALVNVTDYAGQLQWQSNNTWYWGPNDDGSHGEMRVREVDPTGSWWQLYDGSSNVSYLQANGNLGSVNLPNLVSSSSVAFLELGNLSSGSSVTPAVTPTFTGNAASGTVSQPTFTGDSAGSTNVLNTGGVTAVVPAPYTPSGTVSQPTFTGSNVTGSVSNNGQPPSIVRRAWFRR